MELIVKYGNRKLYSTVEKKYLSLLDILERYEEGRNIQIQNHKSKENITTRTILQAIVFFSDEAVCEKLLRNNNVK